MANLTELDFEQGIKNIQEMAIDKILEQEKVYIPDYQKE